MERCPTQAVLPLVGLAAEKVIRDRYSRSPILGKRQGLPLSHQRGTPVPPPITVFSFDRETKELKRKTWQLFSRTTPLSGATAGPQRPRDLLI
ncbi:MAG: hypothetical protein ACQESR_25165 [Planctomycetota bacterium]